MGKVIQDKEFDVKEGIIRHEEGIDLIPGNIELSGIEATLVTFMFDRDKVLNHYIEMIRDDYDYILLDCSPSLGLITINALVAADSVLIPVSSEYLPTKGLEQLINTIRLTRKKINPDLEIEGVLMTIVDERTNLSREIIKTIREQCNFGIRVFNTQIPKSVRVAETPAVGKSIFQYDPKGKAAIAYHSLVKEVLADA